MDCDAFKAQPEDQQTRAERERYTLCAAYQLVRDDLRKLISMRHHPSQDNGSLLAAVKVLDVQLEKLVLAPNE